MAKGHSATVSWSLPMDSDGVIELTFLFHQALYRHYGYGGQPTPPVPYGLYFGMTDGAVWEVELFVNKNCYMRAESTSLGLAIRKVAERWLSSLNVDYENPITKLHTYLCTKVK